MVWLETKESLFIVDQNYMFWKMVARPIVERNNFQGGFGDYSDQSTPFKMWKQMGKL